MSALKSPLKIMCVFGTRPEAIKMAPVVRSLRKHPNDFKTVVVVTAQHRTMLDQVMNLFQISSDQDLNIMQQDQSLDYIVTEVIAKLTPVLKKEEPDLILVHGDTLTTFAASLAAFYLKIPIGHVEAGLRSYDKLNPFPEESNRLLADALSALHFAPTHQAKENLLKENIEKNGIFVTGNTVTDALFIAIREPHQWAEEALKKMVDPSRGPDVVPPGSRLILLTAHRRENHGAPLENVFRALVRIVNKYPDVVVIYPVHLNPHVQKAAQKVLNDQSRIHLIPPVNYLDLVNLLKQSTLVVTDSGGIQEEAPALGKPVLVLRKVTERPEAVAAGTAKISGVEEDDVFADVDLLLSDSQAYGKMANAVNPYGDGKAADRILGAIRYYFGFSHERPEEFMGDAGLQGLSLWSGRKSKDHRRTSP